VYFVSINRLENLVTSLHLIYKTKLENVAINNALQLEAVRVVPYFRFRINLLLPRSFDPLFAYRYERQLKETRHSLSQLSEPNFSKLGNEIG